MRSGDGVQQRLKLDRNVFLITLDVEPIDRSQDGVSPFPAVLHELRKQLDVALRRAFVVFARRFANSPPNHPQAFARRRLVKAARDVDRRLASVSNSLRYLLLVDSHQHGAELPRIHQAWLRRATLVQLSPARRRPRASETPDLRDPPGTRGGPGADRYFPRKAAGARSLDHVARGSSNRALLSGAAWSCSGAWISAAGARGTGARTDRGAGDDDPGQPISAELKSGWPDRQARQPG